ncbi:multidrug ABC transporter ATP-binding protein [Pediococcus damnosus]|uniref:ATP-binding cassette domain-containing protein n=1 Tax=Pediococcus damnosus TaxID=51663 RepID=UPI000C1C8B0C|nr:ATP-binding cassette domain-containing protein [Pediococcus damnosus]PIO80849.1 multidrug ABC transporter ATP-binding protein [Pediococcus damnosus]
MKIELRHFSKTLKKRSVLTDVSYTFNDGAIYGLYGINGSGKTMLLRAMAGLIHATNGEVLVNDKILHKDIDFSPETGILIENMSLLPQYSAFENLKILGKIQHVANDADIENTLKAVGLEANIHEPVVKDFSLGMRQKLNIAQAVFEDQKIILLDEPTNGLDTDSVSKCIKLLRKLRDEGKLIVVATHVAEDMKKLADVQLHIVEGEIESTERVSVG